MELDQLRWLVCNWGVQVDVMSILSNDGFNYGSSNNKAKPIGREGNQISDSVKAEEETLVDDDSEDDDNDGGNNLHDRRPPPEPDFKQEDIECIDLTMTPLIRF
jgi:hypothetical protein